MSRAKERVCKISVMMRTSMMQKYFSYSKTCFVPCSVYIEFSDIARFFEFPVRLLTNLTKILRLY